VAQTFSAFFIVTLVNCGTITYRIDPLPTFATAIDPVGRTVTVQSTLNSEIGDYPVNLVGTLNSYLSVTPLSVPFTISVAAC